MKSLRILAASAAVIAASALVAAPLSFDFKDPKGVNNVAFTLDAPLESISGTGTGITGTVSFDPSAPAATTGKIVLETSSLTVGNAMMRDHMLGNNWLSAEKNPQITFEVTSLANITHAGAGIKADVTGKLTLNGVTRDITVPVTITHLPGKLGARINKPDVKGDLLVLRSTFTVKRGDYNLQAGKNLDKVADEIVISLSIAGSAITG